MKYLHLLPLLLTISCFSAISEEKIRDSVIGDMYKAPSISLSPDPSTPITNSFVDSIITITNLGGVEKVTLNIADTNIELDALKATNYQITNRINLSTSAVIPISILAYSAKTGATSLKRYNYLFDVAGADDPPIIAINNPSVGSTVAAGSLDIDLTVLQSVARVKKVTISSPSFDSQVFRLIDLPVSTNIIASVTGIMSSPLTFSVIAESGMGKVVTNHYTNDVVTKPTIDSVSPPTTLTLSNLTETFDIKVTAPLSTTIKFVLNGITVDTKTISGSGELASFNVPIPQVTTPPYTGTINIQIFAHWPGSSVTTNTLTYNVDHSGFVSGSVLRSFEIVKPASTASTIFLPTTNDVTNISKSEWTNTNSAITVGFTSFLTNRLISPNGSVGIQTNMLGHTNDTSVSPIYLTNIWRPYIYQQSGGSSQYTFLANGTLGPTTTVLTASAIYETPIEYAILKYSAVVVKDMTAIFDFDIYPAIERPDNSNIVQVLVSSSNDRDSDWKPVAVFTRNDKTLSSNVKMPLTFRSSNTAIRISSAKTSGFITTNGFILTNLPVADAYIYNINPAPGSTVPSGTFPFSFSVAGNNKIDKIQIKGTDGGTINVDPMGDSEITYKSSVFSLSTSTTHGAKGFDIEYKVGTTRTTNIIYNLVAPASRYFISLSEDGQVVTDPSFILVITNWVGSSTILPDKSSVTVKRAFTTNSLGALGTTTLYPGNTSTKAITLTRGRNVIEVTLSGVGSVPTLTTNITVYYADLLLD